MADGLEDRGPDDRAEAQERAALDLTSEAQGKSAGMIGPLMFVVVLAILVGGTAFLVRAIGDDGDDATPDVDVSDAAGDAGDDSTPADEPSDQPAGDVGDTAEARDSGDVTDGGYAAPVATADFGYGGGEEWLVPWSDGFLLFGFVYHPAPLPELDDLPVLFPPEVREAIEAAGATTVDEAFAALGEAGLWELVEGITEENPEVMDWLYDVEPLPPMLEVRQSGDGLDWVLLDGISIPGGESIVSVTSDGDHLVVGSQTWDYSEADGPGQTQIWVSITSDLEAWDVHELPTADPDSVPDHVFVDPNLGGSAIGPDGWMVSVNTNAWLDEWSLMPEDIRDSDGGWDTRADESGLTVDIYEAFEPDVAYETEDNVEPGDEAGAEEEAGVEVWPDERDCCEVIETRVLAWDELGIDYATWQQYRERENSTGTTWSAKWGDDPVETVISEGSGGFGSVVGTDAGYVAITWSEEFSGDEAYASNAVLFSTDGRNWVDRPSPAIGPDTWIDSMVAIDDAILASGSDRSGQVVWRGSSDASNWQETEIPGLEQDVWFGLFSSSALPGFAAIVDLQDYSIYERPTVEVDLTVEYEGFVIASHQHADGGSTIVISDAATGGILLDVTSDVSFPAGLPEYISPREDNVAFVDPETGDVVVEISADEILRDWEIAYDAALDDSGWVAPEPVEIHPDYWVLATTDGSSWLLEDLDEGEEPWPWQAAINGDVVIARVGEDWVRYTLI